jgi:L-ascorbate metabolism protein UlaG (beta-lactamase superfamily)
MQNELLYLRPNIEVEPLIDKWYAWAHLIPPATAARNVTERHMKIMDSYISAPQVHAQAAKNPKMLGGPFIDYDGKRVEEIKALREQIKSKRAVLFELSAALVALDRMLKTAGKGFSLQPLYSQVPEVLRGYIELVYDLNNHPSFRLFEPLLYRSKYYDKTAQSLSLSVIEQDDRPFVLSTPRLDSDATLMLPLAFADESVDRIFDLKSSPQPWRTIKEITRTSEKEDNLLASLLTPERPKPYCRYDGSGVRWRYFGHACILIETRNVSMLFDPILSYTYESDVSRYTYRDLPDSIDYVLITHNHQDHVLFETLLQIRRKVKNILVPRAGGGSLQDPSLKLLLENAGFRNVYELSELQTVEFGNGHIMGLPFLGEHADLDIRTKLAYFVQLGEHSLLFAADSCNIEPHLYKRIRDITGRVDVLFVGMECDGAPLTWLYGPLLSEPLARPMDDSRRLAGSNFEQAWDIVNYLSCREVYVYAMGQEPWLNYISSIKYTDQSRPIVESNRLVKTCREHGIVAERLYGEREILLPGTDEALTVTVPSDDVGL